MEIIYNVWIYGMNLLMCDVFVFDFEENICLIKEVVDFFYLLGISVEVELGYVGNEIVYEEVLVGYYYIDFDQVVEFVECTGCDLLVVVIGNQYGVYMLEL